MPAKRDAASDAMERSRCSQRREWGCLEMRTRSVVWVQRGHAQRCGRAASSLWALCEVDCVAATNPVWLSRLPYSMHGIASLLLIGSWSFCQP